MVRRGASNEYTQSMFWIKNEETCTIEYSRVLPYIKVGFSGIHITQARYPDVSLFTKILNKSLVCYYYTNDTFNSTTYWMTLVYMHIYDVHVLK